MITDADTNKLLTAFKKVFPTKESLKEDLNDMRSQILDSVDGKLKAQEKNILEAVDKKLDVKLADQKDAIVKDVADYIADSIVPLIDKQDLRIDAHGRKFAKIERHIGISLAE